MASIHIMSELFPARQEISLSYGLDPHGNSPRWIADNTMVLFLGKRIPRFTYEVLGFFEPLLEDWRGSRVVDSADKLIS